jgi:hypothetical protein
MKNNPILAAVGILTRLEGVCQRNNHVGVAKPIFKTGIGELL